MSREVRVTLTRPQVEALLAAAAGYSMSQEGEPLTREEAATLKTLERATLRLYWAMAGNPSGNQSR